MKYDAEFSSCGLYRYTLLRQWNDNLGILWVMLNPSVADAKRNDPTITRVITRSINAGYGKCLIVNMFGYRSPYSKTLFSVPDPIGPGNNAAIESAMNDSTIAVVVLAWGGAAQKFLPFRQRRLEILKMAERYSRTPLCLGKDLHGNPRHPLHVAYAVELRKYFA